MRPSRNTSVSAPSTSSPSTARALRTAFSTTTSRGSPSVTSSTSAGSTRNSIPSCSRIRFRCGEREASTSTALQLGEEELRLALGRLVRVGPVDHVLPDLERVVTADRARVRLERVSGADHLACRDDRLVPLEHHRDERPAGDERDELVEERLALVLRVMLGGQVAVHLHQL